MREEFLEREPPLRGMASIHEQVDRRVGGRAMHILQGLSQAGQMRALEERCREPVREVRGGRLIERRSHELPQSSLREAFGPGIDGRQMLIGTCRGRRVGAAVFRMHHLETGGPTPHLAEAADAHAAREAVALPRA